MAPILFRRKVANGSKANSHAKIDDSSMSTSLSSTRTETTVATDFSDEAREDRNLSGLEFSDDDDDDWRNDFLSPGSAIVRDLDGTRPRATLSPVASESFEDEETSSSPTSVTDTIDQSQQVVDGSVEKQTSADYPVPLNDMVLKGESIWSQHIVDDAAKSHPKRHQRHQSMTAVSFIETATPRSPPNAPHDASTTPTRPPAHRRSSSLTFQKIPPGSPVSPVSPSAPLSLESLHATLEMRAQRFGPYYFTVGQTWNLIGNYHFRNQECEKAMAAYQEALKCKDGCSDSDHIAAAYGNIGTVCWSTGDLQRSVECLQKALNLRKASEKSHGGDPEQSVSIAAGYHQLGLALSLKQDYGKALDALKHALKIREAVLGRKGIEVARTLDAIGKVHLFRGDADDALYCHQEAYAIWFDSTGGEHSPVVTTSLMNIAAAHMARKDYEQATSTYLAVRNAQVVEIQKAAKEGNPDIIRLVEEAGETSQNLVTLFLKMQAFSNAQVAVDETLRFYQQASLKEDHPRMQALKESAKELQKAAFAD